MQASTTTDQTDITDTVWSFVILKTSASSAVSSLSVATALRAVVMRGRTAHRAVATTQPKQDA